MKEKYNKLLSLSCFTFPAFDRIHCCRHASYETLQLYDRRAFHSLIKSATTLLATKTKHRTGKLWREACERGKVAFSPRRSVRHSFCVFQSRVENSGELLCVARISCDKKKLSLLIAESCQTSRHLRWEESDFCNQKFTHRASKKSSAIGSRPEKFVFVNKEFAN